LRRGRQREYESGWRRTSDRWRGRAGEGEKREKNKTDCNKYSNGKRQQERYRKRDLERQIERETEAGR